MSAPAAPRFLAGLVVALAAVALVSSVAARFVRPPNAVVAPSPPPALVTVTPTPTEISSPTNDATATEFAAVDSVYDGPPPYVPDPPGLWLFYGGEDRLQRIDLDTGEAEVVGMRALPLMVTGSELILGTVGDRRLVGWVSLADPSEMADGWTQASIAKADLPGTLWFNPEDESVWKLVDLASMRQIGERPLPATLDMREQPGFADGVIKHGLDLANVNGDIYQQSDGQWRRVLDGHMLGFTDAAAFVERCDAFDGCRLGWYSRSDWQPVEEPSGPQAALMRRWEPTIVDGRLVVRPRVPASGDAGEHDVSFCCDADPERWAAVRVGDRVALLDRGEVVAWYDGLIVEDGGRILLATKVTAQN